MRKIQLDQTEGKESLKGIRTPVQSGLLLTTKVLHAPAPPVIWVLAVDPGTTMGVVLLRRRNSTSGRSFSVSVEHIETLSGALHLPWMCQDTAAHLGRLLDVDAFHAQPRYVVIEKPSCRTYGHKANPQLLRSFWQVIHLQSALTGYGFISGIDTVDAFEWMARPIARGKGFLRQAADDKVKALWYKAFFPDAEKGNSHTRDAALMGYWWIHTATLGKKPTWNTGFMG